MPVKRALNVGQEIYFLVKSFECGSRDLLAGQDLWMWDNISVSETRACQIHRFIGCFCLIEACDTCRPEAVNEKPQFDKVLVVQVSGEGVWCSRIRYSSGTWVSQMQIHSNFFPSFPIQTFKWNTNKKGVKSRLASDVERRWLAFSEAVGPKTSKCTILELSSLCDKLPDFIFNHHQTIASIASIADLTPDTTTPSHIMSQSSSLFPLVLPPCKLSRAELKMEYSLISAKQQRQPLKTQIEKLFNWLKEPVQLDRTGRALSHRTMENMRKHISQYLGFLQMHLEKQQVSLSDFLDLHSYSAYISFHKAKGNVYSTIVVHITSAKQILQHLQSTNFTAVSKLHTAKEWLSRLQKQLAMLMPKPIANPEDLPEAHQIVRLIENFKQTTLASLPTVTEPPTLQQARAIHDALLACCMFSYMPPVRLVCLRTLQMPMTEGCHTEGCTRLGCQGNRIICKPTEFHLLLSHYKVDHRFVLFFSLHPLFSILLTNPLLNLFKKFISINTASPLINISLQLHKWGHWAVLLCSWKQAIGVQITTGVEPPFDQILQWCCWEAVLCQKPEAEFCIHGHYWQANAAKPGHDCLLGSSVESDGSRLQILSTQVSSLTNLLFRPPR